MKKHMVDVEAAKLQFRLISVINLTRRFVVPRNMAVHSQNEYNIYIPSGQLRFHWGEPIPIIWRSPLKHSRRDWVGIYPYGANQSQFVTKTSSLGLWLPVHDEEWDGDVPRPRTDRPEEELTECGEVIFNSATLPWKTGEFELRYHYDGKFNVLALIGPIQLYLDHPEALNFKCIRRWLSKIVKLALDSDPVLIPRSEVSPSMNIECNHQPISRAPNGSAPSIVTTALPNHSSPNIFGCTPTPYNTHDDDFRFSPGPQVWEQAKRISYAISQVLRIDLEPDVVMADANVTKLTRRILACLALIGR
jgi:phosphatidylethanolamine N-methyltransferase